MIFNRGRYSGFIKPFFYLTDLVIINLLISFFPLNFRNQVLFSSYLTIVWVLISLKNSYYEVQRHTKITLLTALVIRQFFFFFIALYAFIGFFKEFNMSRLALAKYCIFVFLVIFSIKLVIYILLKKYRERMSGNFRNVVVIGKNKKTDQLVHIFNQRIDFGYRFKKQFDPKIPTFNINDCFKYVLNTDIDEIYCSVSELKNKEILDIIEFADNNLKEVKFLPDNKFIFTKKLKYEYYDYLPIISLRDIPLNNPVNSFIKRSFDVLFSLCMIVFLLSWLTPLLAIIIRIESKGPVFFKQKRNGLDNQEFECYKFRSMAVNDLAHQKQATKNDFRVTKIGKFLRRTSLDELPQFFNVFLGEMSVVGPRPHMVSHTNMYAVRINKYMVRHLVKPGITGLAQVRGFRGEVETDTDIINRVKFDIFYIENWSILMDLKIIIQTILNALKGEEKAY